jgi:hypothetical protein
LGRSKGTSWARNRSTSNSNCNPLPILFFIFQYVLIFLHWNLSLNCLPDFWTKWQFLFPRSWLLCLRYLICAFYPGRFRRFEKSINDLIIFYESATVPSDCHLSRRKARIPSKAQSTACRIIIEWFSNCRLTAQSIAARRGKLCWWTNWVP